MEMAPDFSAVLLGMCYQESVKKLNMLLSPADVLHRDVRSLAGLLGFKTDEVSYIGAKQYPFVYMLDQWIKREGSARATLKTLHRALGELKRLDAAEIVEDAVKELDDQDPKRIMHILERHSNQMQRCLSTNTLCTTSSPQRSSSSEPVFEQPLGRMSEHQTPPAAPQLAPPLRANPDDNAPNVFVVYFPDNDKHMKYIRRFIKQLRKKGINATVDMYESTECAQDRGFYIYSKLIQAEYVFVVCSPLFYQTYETYEQETLNQGKSASDKIKEVCFIMKVMLDDIFIKAGINAKYIPVLLPDSGEVYVPTILKGSTIYKMPNDLDDLRRRVFKIEKYKLAPLPPNRLDLQPKEIGACFDLYKLSVGGP